MLKMPDQGILLAPSHLHLLLYEQISKQKGNTLGVQIHPLDSYIQTFCDLKEAESIELLYAMKEKLADLPADNSFAGSTGDYTFLKQVLDFMRIQRLYSIDPLPRSTRKEQDLAAILEKLADLQLKEDCRDQIMAENIPFEKIYILQREYSLIQQFWVSFLLEHGAHYLEASQQKEHKYWSAANSRKEMEAAVREILDQDYVAEDILFALADGKDSSVLEQILEAHDIPYSYLNEEPQSRVPAMWTGVLEYLADPSRETAVSLLRRIDPQAAADLDRWLSVFPEGSHLQDITYEPNKILSEESFYELKQIELQALEWNQKIEPLQNLDFSQLDEAAAWIQQMIPVPEDQDIQIFDQIVQTISAVRPRLKSAADLNLLIQYLKADRYTRGAVELKGAVIGTRSDLSGLRPVAFFIGPHAGLFPGLKTQEGLFDENYLAKTGFLPLYSRLKQQREQIFTLMQQPSLLYVLIPQSDYTGKSLEASAEMSSCMGQMYPDFQAVYDPDFGRSPQIQIQKGAGGGIFGTDHLNTSASRLLSYAGCPFQHYLRYGLKIRRIPRPDAMYISGDIVNHIIQQGFFFYNRQYYELDHNSIQALVEKEFSFVRRVFPDRGRWFDAQVREITFKVETLLEPLSLFQTKYHLELASKTHQTSFSWKREGGNETVFHGSMEPYDGSAASFEVYAPDETRDSGVEFLDTDRQPAGFFQLSMKDTSTCQEALKVSYRTKTPSFEVSEEKKAYEQFVEGSFATGWKQQNLPPECWQNLPKTVLKKPTLENRQEEWKKMADEYIQQCEDDRIQPVHKKDTCRSCPYRSICRNAAREE